MKTKPRTIRNLHAMAGVVCLLLACSRSEPLKLHPRNAHYFLFRGKPSLLVGSTEHYGAVLNLDFDALPYLDALAADGLNLTRTFSGVYCEQPGAFNIGLNTLAPDSGRLICPWARSAEPGYFNGGNKFDLEKWDDGYFARLRDFVGQANRRGVAVEMNLFCVYYEDAMWNLSPLNARNNVNGIGNVPRTEVLALKHPDLTKVQEAMTRKIVTELNRFGNVYYEICNEPYFGVTDAWQRRISAVIVETEKPLPNKHLISQNIANGSFAVVNPDPNVSIFNFHYAVPMAVEQNLHHGKALGDNETGFAGIADDPYRIEAWNFLCSGGALFNHLDYSFTAKHENGTYEVPEGQPGGGGSSIRRQFGFLKRFLESFDLPRLKPAQDWLTGSLPAGISARAIADSGRGAVVVLSKPIGGDYNYALRWTGQLLPRESGTVALSTLSDDGIRVWVEGKKVIENWTDHGPAEDKAVIELQAGHPTDLKVEFYQSLGGAVAKLQWSGKSFGRETVPQTAFGPSGLKVELFEDATFRRLLKTAQCPNVNFGGALATLFPDGRGKEEAGPVPLTLRLPCARTVAQWLDPKTGKAIAEETFDHAGGDKTFLCPWFELDLVLRLSFSETE